MSERAERPAKKPAACWSRVAAHTIAGALASSFLLTIPLWLFSPEITRLFPGMSYPVHAAPYCWVGYYGLSLSLGALAGEREWRRCKNRQRPAPRFILEMLGYSAIFTGILWVVALFVWPSVYGLHTGWVLGGIAAISCLPGSLVAMLVCWAHKARQKQDASTDGPPHADDSK